MRRFATQALTLLLTGMTLEAGQASAPKPTPITHAVLVHGIWQNKYRCWGFLRHDLESRGVKVLVPSLKPADGRDGLMPMAKQLKREVDASFGKDQSFALIAFSMGGLISRSYLQDLGGASNCQAFITISTPHHGTKMARAHYGKGAAEMRPGSVYLSDLELGTDRLGKMPVFSYRTPLDAIIVPSTSSVWDRAHNLSFPVPIHPLMTFSPVVRQDILSRFSYPVPPAPAGT